MKNMERFIPSVCKSIVHVLQSIVDRQESDRNGVLNLTPQVQRLLKDVKSGKVTKATLEKKLKESVQSFDEGELAKVVQAETLREELGCGRMDVVDDEVVHPCRQWLADLQTNSLAEDLMARRREMDWAAKLGKLGHDQGAGDQEVGPGVLERGDDPFVEGVVTEDLRHQHVGLFIHVGVVLAFPVPQREVLGALVDDFNPLVEVVRV